MHQSATRLISITLMAFGLTGPCGCTTTTKAGRETGSATAPRPATINHVVFFKLKNPADADELIADCNSQLAGLPMVVACFCGRPIDTGRGERVDANYDIGLYMGFNSAADYTSYVEHPRHQAMLAKWQPRWDWIRIEDVNDPTP